MSVIDDLGKTVYEAYPKGDGRFADDERSQFLNEACKAILAAMPSQDYPLLFSIEGMSTHGDY